MPFSEADARINIDQLLKEAGWDPADKQQVRTEVPITFSNKVNEPGAPPSSLLTDEDTRGCLPKKADYILLTADGRPLAVVEAKRIAIDPYRAKQQALAYARAIGAPFVFLSNGEVIYFWDSRHADSPTATSNSANSSSRRSSTSTHRKKPPNFSVLPSSTWSPA